ncbi:MAG: DUF1217 domain-containing protein [Pseudomonadota bacterium]
MSFQPIVPLSGYAGWTLLNSTLDKQLETFAKNPVNDRDIQHFRENIGVTVSAEELVSDYQMLRVALGAFGLQDDLPNRAFIRKVLEEGTTNSEAFVNRLADKRYREFSEAFGFGEVAIPKTLEPGFADTILARFERVEFEVAVGEQNEEMRLALNLERALPELAADIEDVDDLDTAWLSILGNPPLRAAMETALGLPTSIGAVDIDQQVEAFREKSRAILGSDDLRTILADGGVERVIQNYLGRAQLASISNVASPGSIAVTLLAPIVGR